MGFCMAILTIMGRTHKTTRYQVWLSRVALVTGQLSVRLAQGEILGMLGQAKCAGDKMIGIMTIQAALITVLELIVVWALMTGLASIRRIHKTPNTGVHIRKVTLGTGQKRVRLGQGKPLRVPGSVYGAGFEMSLGMTIPTSGIAFLELIRVRILKGVTHANLPGTSVFGYGEISRSFARR